MENNYITIDDICTIIRLYSEWQKGAGQVNEEYWKYIQRKLRDEK